MDPVRTQNEGEDTGCSAACRWRDATGEPTSGQIKGLIKGRLVNDRQRPALAAWQFGRERALQIVKRSKRMNSGGPTEAGRSTGVHSEAAATGAADGHGTLATKTGSGTSA